MLKAYVAGPYADKRGHYGVSLNIHRASMVAMELRKRGYAVFCPHCNTAHQDGLIPEEQFLEEDFCFLENCDVCFIVPDMPGYAPVSESKGTMQEIEFCKEREIPVVKTHCSNGIVFVQEEWSFGNEKNIWYSNFSRNRPDDGLHHCAGKIHADSGIGD